MDFIVKQIPLEHVLWRWPQVAKELARVIGVYDPRQSLETTLAMLVTGKQQLHVVECEGTQVAVIVTEIVQYANGFRELLIPGLAGRDIKKWAVTLKTYLQEFMRRNDCELLTCLVRKGLVKLYENVGLEKTPLVPMLMWKDGIHGR